MPTTEYKFTADVKLALAELRKLSEGEGEAAEKARALGKALDDSVAHSEALGKASGHAASRMLILGQAVDDAQYGLRGVVNNMPQVVQAFGGSLGLAGGIGIAAVAISQLSDAWKAYDKMVKDSQANMRLWIGQAEKTGAAIRASMHEPVDALRKALEGANEELLKLQTGGDVTIAKASQSLLALQTAQLAREQKISDRETALYELKTEASRYRYGGGPEVKERIKRDEEILNSLKKTAAEASKAIVALRDDLDTIGAVSSTNTRLKQEADARKDAKKKADKSAKDTASSFDPSGNYRALYEAGRKSLGILSDEEIEREADRQAKALEENSAKLAEEGMKVLEAADKAKAAREKTYADRAELVRRNTLKAFEKYNDAELKLQKDHAKAMAGVAVDAVGAIGNAIVGAATGQKDAWADLLVYAAQATGNMITLKGSEALASGLVAVAGGNPAGVGQIATGLGVIAAGQAISIGGAAAVNAMVGASGGSSPSAARSDPGAAPRRSSGDTGSGSGDLVVNVSYGVAGPLPEDTARAIAAAVRTGDRRRGGGR